jgi:hypothetical protein
MGGWDYGAFDNDFASDWAYELEESDALETIVAAIDQAEAELEDGLIEIPTAQIVVAASAVLVTLMGKAVVAFPEHVAAWVDSHSKVKVPPTLAARAGKLLKIIVEDEERSEMHGAFVDDDGLEKWTKAVAPIAAALK